LRIPKVANKGPDRLPEARIAADDVRGVDAVGACDIVGNGGRETTCCKSD
jgi:hypothetical protein